MRLSIGFLLTHVLGQELPVLEVGRQMIGLLLGGPPVPLLRALRQVEGLARLTQQVHEHLSALEAQVRLLRHLPLRRLQRVQGLPRPAQLQEQLPGVHSGRDLGDDVGAGVLGAVVGNRQGVELHAQSLFLQAQGGQGQTEVQVSNYEERIWKIVSFSRSDMEASLSLIVLTD